jgi:hypothetical protein
MQSFHLRHHGFTLVEVAFSIAIMMSAVLTVMLLMAASLRSQQHSRLSTYAAVLATSLMEEFQQDAEDLRARQDFNNPYTRAFVKNKDGAIQDIERSSRLMNSGANAHFNAAGTPDLEKRLLDTGRIIPIPTPIARRLDSPGDAIGRMLDAGGKLFYVNPTASDAGSGRALGNRSNADESRRLVVGIVGAAQQNCLPNHPLVLPPRMMYPFPPQATYGDSLLLYSWKRKPAPGSPLVWDGKCVTAGDLPLDSSTYNNGYGSPSYPTLINGATWEEQAYADRLAGMSSTASKWRAGLPEFWRLSVFHWGRIYQQIRANGFATPNITITVPVYSDVTRTITEPTLTYDRLGNATITYVSRTITEKVQTGTTTVSQSAGTYTMRGVPSPPIGLPQMQGGRGTDILYEDAETLTKERWSQIRVGLPGLERRVMYRSAALALWGKVDGHGSITEVGLNELGDFTKKGSPNIIATSALPTARNPLLSDIPLPANPADIHPAQVLAMSYLAHAAILVTGYKPPFVDEKNSMDPTQHVNLVPNEALPYKTPTADTYYLYHPFYQPTTPTTSLLPACDDTSLSPLNTADGSINPATDPRLARDMNGDPITYKRVSGTVVNPFPGPYADRGAFNWMGVAAWTRDPATLQITSHGAYPTGTGFSASDPSDSMMARTAMENCLRWAMAYIRENPYDMIVPKPYNSPTSLDRPLYAFNLFDGSGNALRTAAIGNNSNLYSVLWGSDRATWPKTISGVGRCWSPWLWLHNNNAHTGSPIAPHNTLPLYTQQNGSGTLGSALYLDATILGDVTRNGFGSSLTPDAFVATRPTGHPLIYSYTFNNGTRNISDVMDTLSKWNGYASNPYALAVSLAGSPPGSAAVQAALKQTTSPNQSRWWYENAFAPADRTRQLVFWSVDWQSYEDAESQPSDPVDFSHWNLTMSNPSSYMPGNDPAASRSLRSGGHPERELMWANPARDGKNSDPPQKDVELYKWKYDGNNILKYRDVRGNVLGTGMSFTNIVYDPGDYYPWSRVGTWGADRNANGIWDRGRIPSNVRMSAEEVARFPFYDPVIWTTLGN